MKTVSLFSGIGGLDLGLEEAGHEVILQVENDPHCVQVLQRQFPGKALARDVAEVIDIAADIATRHAGGDDECEALARRDGRREARRSSPSRVTYARSRE